MRSRLNIAVLVLEARFDKVSGGLSSGKLALGLAAAPDAIARLRTALEKQ